MFASDNSNFYFQLYYEIIIIITKTSPNILQIAILSFYWCIILTSKFHKLLKKLVYTLFIKWMDLSYCFIQLKSNFEI